jgi:D-alanine-D-alanine ligase
MKNEFLLNIGVIIGGESVEHEISLISGLQTILNLDKKKYNVFPIYLTKENEFIYLKKITPDYFKNNHHLNKKTNCYFKRINKTTYLIHKLKKYKIDCLIPVVHGKGVEDGTIQALSNLLKIPSTSSNILQSAISQNKAVTKKLLKLNNIRMLPFIELDKEYDIKKINKINETFNYPLIVKPTTLGSSVGIKTAHDKTELLEAIKQAKSYDNSVIIEEKRTNFTEYNIACFSYKGILNLSQIEEVKSNNEFLTFDDKYLDGGLKETTKENRIIPANIDESLEKEIHSFTKTIYKALNATGIIRIDYLFDKETNKLYFNEINTIPGSLAFYLYKDYSFTALLDSLIKDAVYRFNINENLITSFDTNILNIKNLHMKK